ncbi:hypothetical protein D3C84_618980 [compost metagenome]
MLGKKKFLWTNVLLVIVYLVFYFATILRWNDICRAALPDNMGTAFFYYIVMSTIFGWYSSRLAFVVWKWNTARYNEQYELEVNRFIYKFAPDIAYKINRHEEFAKLNDLLLKATRLSKELQCSH